MKEVLLLVAVGIFLTSIIIVMIVLKHNPFKKIFLLFKREKMIMSKNETATNYRYTFDESVSAHPEEIHNTLPVKIKRKFSVIYDHKLVGFENIIIFKSSNEKWGALKFENGEYLIIAESIYDSTGFYPQYKLIPAVIYTTGTYSGKKIYILFDMDGRIVKKFDHIDHIIFDRLGHVTFSQNDLHGLLNKNFEEIIPAKYKIFSALEKNLFLVRKQYDSEQLFINEKEEIIYNLGFSDIIHKHIHNGKIIIKESAKYYLLNLSSGDKYEFGYDLIYPVSRLYDLSLLPVTKFITVKDYVVNEDGFDDIFPDKFMEEQGKYGIINADGEICVPNMYDKIQQIHDDHFKVAIGKFSFEINDNGEVIATGGKWGIINSKNDIIVPIKYTHIFYNKQGNFYSAFEDGYMVGYENSHDENYWWTVKDGKEIEIRI